MVDGVILDNISFLNSADIESMEILKDASATAIYGSRGANGVIMVTTKAGKVGDAKPTISYSGEVSLQKVAKKIDLLNGKEFATIANEITTGTYNNTDLVPNTDWQDLIFHTARCSITSFQQQEQPRKLSTILPWGISSKMELLTNQITRGLRLN